MRPTLITLILCTFSAAAFICSIYLWCGLRIFRAPALVPSATFAATPLRWVRLPRRDAPDQDIGRHDCAKRARAPCTLAELAAACAELVDCKAFNSDGVLKRAAETFSDSPSDLYVKSTDSVGSREWLRVEKQDAAV